MTAEKPQTEPTYEITEKGSDTISGIQSTGYEFGCFLHF